MRFLWSGHADKIEEIRNAYRILIEKPLTNRPLGRPRRRWILHCEDRRQIQITQDRIGFTNNDVEISVFAASIMRVITLHYNPEESLHLSWPGISLTTLLISCNLTFNNATLRRKWINFIFVYDLCMKDFLLPLLTSSSELLIYKV